MDCHFDADGSTTYWNASAPDIPQKIESCLGAAGQADNKTDLIRQCFQTEVNRMSKSLENVNYDIEIKADGNLLYRRLKRPGKHAIIDYDVIINSKCRICGKTFQTPFQARTSCCEAIKDFPWPVSCTDGCETGNFRYDSIDDLTRSLQFVPPKNTLVYYCPFVGCGWKAKGSPDYRHANEQHLLALAKDKDQPILCTIGNCGLYLKRPDEKIKQHRDSTHRHEIEKGGKPTKLPASTPVLLAALAPDRFYEPGLQYYREECEYKANKMKDEDSEAVTTKPPSSRKRCKEDAGKRAPKPTSSRKQSVQKPSNKLEAAKQGFGCQKGLRGSKRRRTSRRNSHKEELKSNEGTLLCDQSLANLSLGHIDNHETSIDYFENLTLILGDSSSSITTAESSFYWCNEEEASFANDIRSFPCLKMLPEEPQPVSAIPSRS